MHDGRVQLGSAPGRIPSGSGRLRSGPETVADEIDDSGGSSSAEWHEVLSGRSDEVTAVLDEARKCDPSQVGVALDAGLDVVGDLVIDFGEESRECVQGSGINLHVRSHRIEPADDVEALRDRQAPVPMREPTLRSSS